MDPGLNGKRALACASTGGLGYPCAAALAAEGAEWPGRRASRSCRL